jgi:hypothetical protein
MILKFEELEILFFKYIFGKDGLLFIIIIKYLNNNNSKKFIK